jgi:hypothetical protein
MDSIETRLAKLEGKTPKSYFTLKDGSKYKYDPNDLWRQTVPYMGECAHSDIDSKPRPPVPPIYVALCKARNREAALKQIFPLWPERPPLSGIDLHHLVDHGEIRLEPICEAFPPYEPSDFEEGEL